MPQSLIELRFIPLDKSWIIRMGILDLLGARSHIFGILEQNDDLSNDLKALYVALKVWDHIEVIDVGESGTLYRFLQFIAWKKGLSKTFITHATLKKRNITHDPNIVNLQQDELIRLDNGTSQWASAAVLCGDLKRLVRAPFKLQLTYDAVTHWNECAAKNIDWEPRYDKTILAQAETFLQLLKDNVAVFKTTQAEDYCFARAFGFVDRYEGEKLWPSLSGHESNRLEEMETALGQLNNLESITSADHRVVQALAMKAAVVRKEVHFKNPEVVAKSWPQFWRFLKFGCPTPEIEKY